MSRTILPDAALDDLRTIGDPSQTVPRTIKARDEQLRLVRADGVVAHGAPSSQPTTAPIDIDVDKLEVAQQQFARYGTEIGGALLLAALPQSYATSFGAGVLGANAQLETDLARRVRRTMRFLLTVMQEATDEDHQLVLWDPAHASTGGHAAPEPSTLPWQVCDNLRRYHALIRNDLERQRKAEPSMPDGQPGPVTRMLGSSNFPPLNQEDLLGMLLTFSITVFEVLERYGITWTDDEQEAYLHAWDVVGAYLGIGSPAAIEQFEKKYNDRQASDDRLPPGPLIDNRWHGLRPPTVDGTRVLLDQIRDRQWIDPTPSGPLEMDAWSSLRAGRLLTRALLDELEAAMPRSLERLPIAVMRSLADNRVRTRLNLGGNGLLLGAVARLPQRTVLTERFTMWSAPNVVAARMLRVMANDVTSRAAVRFIDNDDFVIPGSSDWV